MKENSYTKLLQLFLPTYLFVIGRIEVVWDRCNWLDNYEALIDLFASQLPHLPLLVSILNFLHSPPALKRNDRDLGKSKLTFN